MLSTAIKTSLVFFLVVIVIHLMIRKALNERCPPPPPTATQLPESVVTPAPTPTSTPGQSTPASTQPLIPAQQHVVGPVVQCTVQAPPSTDDLFNFVFKCKTNLVQDEKKKQEKQQQPPSAESGVAIGPGPTLAQQQQQPLENPADVAGICSFEDECTSIYGSFAST